VGLNGRETFNITGIAGMLKPLQEVTVVATKEDGTAIQFNAIARLDSAIEIEYYRHGGILQYVLRQFLEKSDKE
jgi:aconitate hydratase